jgi:hypothetical protein
MASGTNPASIVPDARDTNLRFIAACPVQQDGVLSNKIHVITVTEDQRFGRYIN